MDPNNSRMLKPRGGIKTLSRKIRKITKFDGDTQKIRGDLILDLKVLAEPAHDQATKIKKGGRITMGQILSEAMRKYILNTTKQGYTKEGRKVYYRETESQPQ